MRWRLVDKVTGFEPWGMIAARKTISFEEYSLLKVFGRKGSFPETLILEACVEASRWLVAASSEFAQTCALTEVETFSFAAEVGRGDILDVSLRVRAHESTTLRVECRAHCGSALVSEGIFTVKTQPLSESFDRDWVTGLWREIYAKA